MDRSVDDRKRRTEKQAEREKEKEAEASKSAQRVWTDDDVLNLLSCVAEFRSSTGDTPTAATVAAFLDSFKHVLPDGVRKSQVLDKLGHMKKKYRKIANNGLSRCNSNSFYDYAVKAWGAMGNEDDVEEEEEEEEEGGPTSSQYPMLTEKLTKYFQENDLSEEMLNDRLPSINPRKAKGLEKRCKKLAGKGLELQIQEDELKNEVRKLLLEGFRRH